MFLKPSSCCKAVGAQASISEAERAAEAAGKKKAKKAPAVRKSLMSFGDDEEDADEEAED